MNMGITIKDPMNMGMNIGIIFENWYGYGCD